MNYKQAVDYIFAIPRFSKKTTRENLLYLFAKLGNPQNKMKAVHIAGTNGKGSVCAFLESVLLEAGYHTGMFTSPHLISVNERIKVNGKMIGDEDFLNGFHQVKSVVDHMEEEGRPHVSFFEFLFAMAVWIFAEKGIEYGIFETGLGGRLDATNILMPKIVILTSIGLDHIEYLGDTIEAVAGEKAGIIKEGIPVVYGDFDQAASTVIKAKIQKEKAKGFPISREDFKILEKNHKTIDFCIDSSYDKYDIFTIHTYAAYQVENAVLAITAAKRLCPAISSSLMRSGISKMRWPGRMEEISPNVIVDGAHNESAIQSFIENIDENCDRKKSLLFAVAADKDYTNMIRSLCNKPRFERIFITGIAGTRGRQPESCAVIYRKYTKTPIIVIEQALEAFRIAEEYKEDEEILYCVGSLYLVGYLKEIVNKSVD